MSCSSIPEAAGSCDQCFHFDLGSSNSPSDNFVPRTGIASGSYEFIYTAQSSITGTTYQGATVTPTGNITNLFNLTERGVANNSWTWASMKSGNAITKGTVPTTIDIGRPIYLLKFTTLSGIKDINNVIQSGQDVTHRECAFYYQTAPTAFCGNGNREGTEQCDDGNTVNTDACSNTCTTNSAGACGTQNNNSVYDQSSGTALVASTSGLCASGAVASFLYSPSQNRWTWSCAGSNNGASPSCQANRTYCGNGTIESTEQCDDGNTNNNDGCNTSCRIATIPSPAIRIYKDDADNRDDRQTITSGARPRFTITVINYGNVDLRDVVVTDQRAPGCDKTIGTLVRNDSKTYTCEGTTTTASFTNTARATGRSITDTTVVSDDDTTEVTVGATAVSCTVGASNKSGYAPLQTTLTCSGSPSGKTVMAIKKNGATLELINASSKNYTFNNIGSYTVVCYPDGSQQNQGNACTTTIQVGSLCGNRKVEGAEQCDDGNTRGGDGCNQYCEIEYKIQPIC